MKRLKDKIRQRVFHLSLLLPLFIIFSAVPGFSQVRPPACDLSVVVNISTAVTTQIVTNAVADTAIRICSINLTLVGSATANQVTFEYGTGTLCATGLTTLTGPFSASVTVGSIVALLIPAPLFKPTPVAVNMCIVTTQAALVSGVVSYSVY